VLEWLLRIKQTHTNIWKMGFVHLLIIYLQIYEKWSLFVCLFDCLFIYLIPYLVSYLFVCLFVCNLFIWLFVCLFVLLVNSSKSSWFTQIMKNGIFFVFGLLLYCFIALFIVLFHYLFIYSFICLLFTFLRNGYLD
jgi:hypothetical protein